VNPTVAVPPSVTGPDVPNVPDGLVAEFTFAVVEDSPVEPSLSVTDRVTVYDPAAA
jgi:hypothetical protein